MQSCSSFEKMEPQKSFVIVALIFLSLAGLFLRSWNLDRPSLWVDEVIYAHTAQSWLETGEMKVPSGHHYTRAPFYTMGTALVYKIFGQGDAETRATSVFLGMLSLLMTYFLARKIFDKKTALIAMFLMAFSHFEIGWSRTARMYTMLQFLTLCITYCLIQFVEPENRYPVLVQKFFEKLKINPVWLLPAIILICLGYLYVHMLTVFLLISFCLYLVLMAIIQMFIQKEKEKWHNKYFFLSVLFIVLLGVGIIVYPKSLNLIHAFLHYTPPWASGDVSALNRALLFEFLISPYRFPLAFLFFIGVVQVFTRWRLRAILALILFAGQLLLLSFVFTHRKPVYLFNVYPIFLMIASYGFLNILYAELNSIKEKMQAWNSALWNSGLILRFAQIAVLVAFMAIIILSPWFRIALKIPFHQDGITNMAVTPVEWKEAAKIMKQKAYPEDLVFASHPELCQYYHINVDYTLNWTLLNQAKSQNLVRGGHYFDNYSGVPCLESLEQLEFIIASHDHIWLLIDAYAYRKEAYIPSVIRQYIDQHFEGPFYTHNKTLLIFHYSRQES